MEDSSMIWSFSRLSSFHNCKLGWKLSYIDNENGISNAWAQAGTLIHDIFEKFAKGELKNNELMGEWFRRYSEEVENTFPSFKVDLYANYERKVGRYLEKFIGFSGDVKGVELEFLYDLPNGDKIRGFIDLITEIDNEIIVTDHKLSKKFKKKDLKTKARQIQLYAPAIKNEFGVLPIYGIFHFVQDGSYHKVAITEESVNKAMDWAVETIEAIKNEKDFEPIVNGMNEKELKDNAIFCKSICNHRETCEAKKLVYG